VEVRRFNLKLKILNAFPGLGGNRRLWGDRHEVTAVEYNLSIAKFYQDHFKNDNVVIGCAFEYILNNYKEFDFIWASPPCPSHSRARFWNASGDDSVCKPVYPDFRLYELVTFLKHYFKGLWCVENVKPFYEPLMNPKQVGRHLFWSNFNILPFNKKDADCTNGKIEDWEELHGFDISEYKFDDVRRDKVLRNCVNPDLGNHILECAIDINSMREKEKTQQLTFL